MDKRPTGIPGIHEEVVTENGHLKINTVQDVSGILKETHRRRTERSARDTDGLGRAALTIPLVEYNRLLRANPDLDQRVNAHEDVTRAWLKFMQSPESKPWRNHDKI